MQPRPLLPLLSLVLVSALAGCAGQPMVSTADRLAPVTAEAVLPYSFLPCSAAIGGSEQDRIRKFLNDLGLTAQDTLVVSVPKNRLPRRDAERRKTLEGLFAAYPAKVHFVQDSDLRVLPRSEPTGIIRVVRTTGIAVDCPQGAADPGCATAGNLAAMMAEPSDLFLPEKGSRYLPPADAGPSP